MPKYKQPPETDYYTEDDAKAKMLNDWLKPPKETRDYIRPDIIDYLGILLLIIGLSMLVYRLLF